MLAWLGHLERTHEERTQRKQLDGSDYHPDLKDDLRRHGKMVYRTFKSWRSWVRTGLYEGKSN
jgi:hypothetical protein